MKKEATITEPLKYPGLQTQPGEIEASGSARQALRRFLRAQFGRPSGLWGHVVGAIMALRSSNKERSRWTLSLLDIKPTDRLLEIGFGPGFAIEQASRLATAGLVAGVDHSDVMVQQATRRNAGAMREGRVMLRLGSAADVPNFDQPFDKIYTINSIHFWEEPVECLKKLRALLKPGGLIAVTLQPRSQSATEASTRAIGDEVAEKLELAGFSQVRVEIKSLKPLPAACAIGVNLP